MFHLIIDEREDKLRPIRVSQANEENRMMNIAKNDICTPLKRFKKTNWRDSRRRIVPGDRKNNKLKALQIIGWVKASKRQHHDNRARRYSPPQFFVQDIAMIIIFETEKLVFRGMRLTMVGIQSKVMTRPPTNEFQWSYWEKIHSAHKIRAYTIQVRSSKCDLETKRKYAIIPTPLSSLVTLQISTTRTSWHCWSRDSDTQWKRNTCKQVQKQRSSSSSHPRRNQRARVRH